MAAKYCDLVMKGGITSGIVYPNAVLALARDYRFKSIGGTSAGAIAAAVAAAAALGDRRRQAGETVGPQAGFEGLAGVSAQLSTRGFIYGLFQPARGARAAYRLLVVLASHAGWPRKLLCLLAAVFTIAPLEVLLSLVVLLGIGYGAGGVAGMLATLLPSLLCAYGAGVAGALLRVARVARGNLLGLCNGRSDDPQRPALTDWLHEALQRLSGKPDDAPLTFADLHGAPRYADEPQDGRAITLQMISTCVSHNEPRTLPFSEARFWFLREEFDRLFPRSVVDGLVADAGAPEQVDGRLYYRLPPEGQLPVLVATRMSLSFPLLISAVPLHEPARHHAVVQGNRAEPGRGGRNVADSMEGLASGGQHGAAAAGSSIAGYRRCWFSDGGISSNFPIHLFDAALPRWPTFAINLVYPGDAREVSDAADAPQALERAVVLPTGNRERWQRGYRDIASPMAATELTRFLFAIVATMQNWRDLLQARAPGYRDRIVHVTLEGDEGGMNLDMPQEVLGRIAQKGTLAGERFCRFSFENHYWIRWRNAASAYQRYTLEVSRTDDAGQQVLAYRTAYASVAAGQPPPPSYPLGSQEKRRQSQALYALMVEQGASWDDCGPDLTDGAPRPLPQMKVTPIY